MKNSTGHHKVQSNAMKAYRKQRQYIYHHCQLCHVTASYGVIVGVCILMLPMLELATEHVQLTTMYCMNSINVNRVHARHMIFSHTYLLQASLNNILPSMVLQNVTWSNSKRPSSHSRVCRVSHSPALTTGLGRRVVGVVIILLLLMSGDIEMNPGPLCKYTFLIKYWKLKYTVMSYHLPNLLVTLLRCFCMIQSVHIWWWNFNAILSCAYEALVTCWK